MDIAILSDQGNHFFRFLHILFGIVWIGLLYYFNFVQMEYFKEAEAGAKADAIQKLAPRALWWFRWAAFFTFLTGAYLLHVIAVVGLDLYITVGAILGTLMFLNVWGIIWPNQKIVIGLKEGDKAVAGARAGVASRTNVLFSMSMLLFMVSGTHVQGAGAHYLVATSGLPADASVMALAAALVIIAVLELNAIAGKMGPLATIKGVIGCSAGLAVVLSVIIGLL